MHIQFIVETAIKQFKSRNSKIRLQVMHMRKREKDRILNSTLALLKLSN